MESNRKKRTKNSQVVGHARLLLSQLPARLAYTRKLKKLTQAEVAKMMGMCTRSVTYWESGKFTPTINDLAEWADICDTTIPYLLGYEGYDEPLRVFTGEIPVRKIGAEDIARASRVWKKRKPRATGS